MSAHANDVDVLLTQLGYDIEHCAFALRFWGAFRPPERARFEGAFASFPVLSDTVEWSLFSLLVLVLYRQHETRADTINFGRLLDALECEGHVPHETTRIVRQWLRQDPWPKVAKLRNEVLAHVTCRTSVESVFERAAISALDLAELVVMAHMHHSELARASGRTPLVYPESSELERLLVMLRDHHA